MGHQVSAELSDIEGDRVVLREHRHLLVYFCRNLRAFGDLLLWSERVVAGRRWLVSRIGAAIRCGQGEQDYTELQDASSGAAAGNGTKTGGHGQTTPLTLRPSLNDWSG